MNTREEWLNSALALIRAHLWNTADKAVPLNTRVSCGFPGGASRKAIGQCWAQESSADGSVEIFVSPTVADPETVLAILVHEAVHAAVGLAAGHRAPFKKVAELAGLTGKMTATVATPYLTAIIGVWMGHLGAYPHATLTMGNRKKQSTRMLKASCPCGYTVRVTSKWAIEGAPYCGVCVVTDEDMHDVGMPIRMSVEMPDADEGDDNE